MKRLLFKGILLLLLAIGSMPAAGWAAESAGQTAEAPKRQPIQITSNTLVANNKENSAEFIGNVLTKQGDTVIRSDRLKIFYKEGGTDPDLGGQNAVDQIVATGNVTIDFDDKHAVTDRAVYSAREATLTLIGPGSTVTSGKNTIAGEKITVYRKEDRMMVESGEQKRVQAVFYTEGDEGLQ